MKIAERTAAGRRERRVLPRVPRAAQRLDQAGRERSRAPAPARARGVSIRALAAAVRLSSSRVHQIVAAADLDELDAALGELRAAGWPPPEDPDGDDDAELDGRDTITDRLVDEVSWLRQCSGWLTRLHADDYPPAVSLRPGGDHPERALVVIDLPRVAAILDRIAAGIGERARARRVRDLNAAAVLPDPRAGRRRRPAGPDLEFRAFCTRRRLPASPARHWSGPGMPGRPGDISAARSANGPAAPVTVPAPLTATRAAAHTRAVQETGRRSGADGSIVTGTPIWCSRAAPGRRGGQETPSIDIDRMPTGSP